MACMRKLPRVFWKGAHRLLSTQFQHSVFDYDDERSKLEKDLPRVFESILAANSAFFPETEQNLRECFASVTPFVHIDRGMKLIETFAAASTPQTINEVSMHVARTLALCCELVTSSFFIIDDVLDGRDVRNNRPSYHVESNGNAMLDAILLNHAAQQLTANSIKNRPKVKEEIVRLLQNASTRTTIGMLQARLIRSRALESPEEAFDSINMNKYQSTVTSKIEYTAFELPIGCGLLLAEKEYDKMIQKAAVDMGVLLQIEKDLRVVENGTALNNGYISWPIVMAKQLANKDQLSVLRRNFLPTRDKDSEVAIRRIFETLRLKQNCKMFREGLTGEVNETIQRSHIGERAKRYLLDVAQDVLKGTFNRFD
ncbi:unnamed protein product [Notodromas monacha]|uniref:Uncharacterized protein n=1 Tax=Notodromas monacha TaxID=399045 RepID=A0A7R9GC69_9CRUS|nr:unnamed protein product [Notodromas monacha]CAG0917164.1 unnamed protein product [Notodromas monacha]